jgi:hypothetical protein
MTFIKPYIIRLSHCDATGQVFYPNYFHIFNALVEDWFYEGLEIRYDELLMQRGLSLPTVKLESTFLVPTRMGEVVDFWLIVSHLGRGPGAPEPRGRLHQPARRQAGAGAAGPAREDPGVHARLSRLQRAVAGLGGPQQN